MNSDTKPVTPMPTPVPPPPDDSARFGPLDAQTWPRLASRVAGWADRGGVVLRDAVWLLPFSALLPQARKAFAQCGGWSPRIETPATLAVQLGPRAAAVEGTLSADPVTRRLQAQAMLRAQAGGPEWARQDPGGFGHAVAALVEAATTWHAALCARPPEARVAWLDEARSRLAAARGPGERERVLARVGLEWAADSVVRQPPASDLLFEARPSAWVALRAGGAQPLVEAVLARAAADEVLAALARHPEGSVALVAQDREAVRRVRALLDRAGALVVDDTGWRLSTTRAGTRAMALLRAVRALGRRGAGAEDLWLAWLKDDAWAARQSDALRALEGLWRGRRLAPWQREAAEGLWAAARQRLEPLQALRRAPLADWLQALAALWLEDPDDAAFWREDPAGRAVLSAWRLEAPWSQAPGWRVLATTTRMDLDDLIEWADQALNDERVVPEHPPQARVVITPLARAMLRPFVAAGLPGTDERRLGGAEPGNDLIGPAPGTIPPPCPSPGCSCRSATWWPRRWPSRPRWPLRTAGPRRSAPARSRPGATAPTASSPSACWAWAATTNSTAWPRSATTATGCTRCCTTSTRPAGPSRCRPRTPRGCAPAPRRWRPTRAWARARCCPSWPASRPWSSPIWPGCTAARPRAGASRPARSRARSVPRCWAGCSCAAGSTASTPARAAPARCWTTRPGAPTRSSRRSSRRWRAPSSPSTPC